MVSEATEELIAKVWFESIPTQYRFRGKMRPVSSKSSDRKLSTSIILSAFQKRERVTK